MRSGASARSASNKRRTGALERPAQRPTNQPRRQGRKLLLRLVPEALEVRFPDLSYTSPDLGAGARVRVTLRQDGLVMLDEGRAEPPGE